MHETYGESLSSESEDEVSKLNYIVFYTPNKQRYDPPFYSEKFYSFDLLKEFLISNIDERLQFATVDDWVKLNWEKIHRIHSDNEIGKLVKLVNLSTVITIHHYMAVENVHYIYDKGCINEEEIDDYLN